MTDTDSGLHRAPRQAVVDEFARMAEEIVALHDASDEVSECGYACHWHGVYGWVPEADCPVHDPEKPVDP